MASRFLLLTALEAYAEKHSPPESRLFRDLARVTRAKTACPQMQVGRLEGGFLRLMVKIARAKQVLEIGTFTGYSALAMATETERPLRPGFHRRR